MANTTPLIELFSIGTELVYGQIHDTNSFWMAKEIVALGARVRRITQLIDDRGEIKQAFQTAIDRGTDLAICSGGLGPTPDDLTSEILAEIAGVRSVPHENVIEDYMTRRGVPNREEMNPNLVRMATAPTTARCLLNPVGWAPCIALDVGATTFLALPGPPREMEAVFKRHVAPFISERYERRSATQRVLINTHESSVAPYFEELKAEYPGSYMKGYIADTSNPGWLPVDIVAVGETSQEAHQTLQAIIDALRKKVEQIGKTVTVSPGSIEEME